MGWGVSEKGREGEQRAGMGRTVGMVKDRRGSERVGRERKKLEEKREIDGFTLNTLLTQTSCVNMQVTHTHTAPCT